MTSSFNFAKGWSKGLSGLLLGLEETLTLEVGSTCEKEFKLTTERTNKSNVRVILMELIIRIMGI
jgi:hypothetical protein